MGKEDNNRNIIDKLTIILADDGGDSEDSDYSEEEETSFGAWLHPLLPKKKDVSTIEDLVGILRKCSKKRKHGALHPKYSNYLTNLIESLEDLDNLVGMGDVKQKIVDQLILFIQDMQDPGMFLHSVITGPQGTGKTTLAQILGRIYKNMGFLKKSEIVVVDRSDLIGGYLGQTSQKTKKVLKQATGGVLLIDEAYSLGNREGRDSYSKECIDMINQYLSEHPHELVCIIAGYEKEIEECFFAQNKGLARRFPWRYRITTFSPLDICRVFISQCYASGWSFWLEDVEGELVPHFERHRDYFPNNGGDTKNLLDRCKIQHARRLFTQKSKKEGHRVLTLEDIKMGLKDYLGMHKDTTDRIHLPYFV